MPKVVSYRSVDRFWRATGALYSADPVRNTVALTVLDRLRVGARFGTGRPIFLAVHDAGRVIGAVLCTPPFPLAISTLPLHVVDDVVDRLVSDNVWLSGASGMRAEVEAFVDYWAECTGVSVGPRMEQRLYRLGRLVPPKNVPGMAVTGTEDDVELLADWRIAFTMEAISHRGSELTRTEVRQQVRDSIAAGGRHLVWWADGKPVSMAAVSAVRGGMSRIAPVYTPPECRGHGYGSSATAAAATWALERGAEHVLLFADLANPVSNSIYQRIGFVPVADALDVTFRLP
jgi:GNAT superfamily N-acetyltransferase